jgi:formylglycine-generating enzyme required for sulfatase activity
MARIFISYRRADSQAITGRIYDRVVQAFGKDAVFKDVDAIPPGSSFAEVLEAELNNCNAVLVIIGRQWLNIKDDAGNRRLDNPEDYVRLEVERGLSRPGLLLIPVQVDGADIPKDDDLPDSLKALPGRNAVIVRHDPDFHRDMDRLIAHLGVIQQRDEAVQRSAQRQIRRVYVAAAVIAALVAVIFIGLVLSGAITLGPVQPTLSPREIAMQLNTLTAEAIKGSAGTATIEAILVGFETETLVAVQTEQAGLTATALSFTDTPTPTQLPTATFTPSLTPSNTPTPTLTLTPTTNFTTTAQARETSFALETTRSVATQIAQATNNALETLRAPTNTPVPTDTATPTSTATSSATPSPTATLTNTATATFTLTATPTLTPTASPSPTLTPSSTSSPDPAGTQAARSTAIANAQATVAAQETAGALQQIASVISNQPINLRSGPSTNDSVLQALSPGTQLEIIATNPAGDWLNVRLSDGSTGWIASALAGTVTPTPFVLPANALGSTDNPVTRNADWMAVEQDFDGVTMVLVPAGCFDMGSNDGAGNEQPVHEQCFDSPFWIDKYEVTQLDFARMGGVKVRATQFTGANRPVESITWFEARKYCEDNRQMRLPTEREWEYAARGPDNLVYPRGNTWDENNAVWSRNSNNQTAEVGSRPAGVSWVGALDMSGNVWEWVSSAHTAYPYDADDGREDLNRTNVLRGWRGGSWNSPNTAFLRAPYRGRYVPYLESGNLGFRCARSYNSESQTATSISIATLPPGFTPITRNADWTALEQDFDGATMVLVPAGCFDMGSNDGDSDEQPVHEQCINEPFWIDKYEVTNGQFARFGGQAGRASTWKDDNRPRESITWFEARDFCALRSASLPTEREWEYAVRGPDNLIYPWGNTWDENNAVWDGNSNNQTADVGSRPAGVSWVGALDMSGNVWEWVSSIYSNYPYAADDGREDLSRADALRGLRGGSWNYSLTIDLRAPNRYRYLPDYVFNGYGFRCARSYNSES